MFEVQYWKGVIPFNVAEFEAYKPLILRLLSGDTKGADLDLKCSADHKIYSVKLNDAGRLLFTTVDSKILLLEVLPTHKYNQSRFLKSKVLRDFKDKHAQNLSDNIAPIWLDIEPDDLDLQRQEQMNLEISYQPVSRYNKQFLSLTPEQFTTLQAPFPLLLTGPPGSGKSLLIGELIEQAENELVSDDCMPIACVCRSEGVRDYLSEQYQQTPKALDDKQNIVFLTYNELLLQLWHSANPTAEFPPDFVGKTDCLAFIESGQVKGFSLAKSGRLLLSERFLKADPDLIYQEFYLMASLSLEAYLDKGTRQTLFTDEEDRRAIFDLFQRYQADLDKKNVIHPAFYILSNAHPLFRKMLVDEAQDLSLMQLQQLLSVTENHQMACAMDQHQSLTVSQSLRVALSDLLSQGRTRLSSYQLTHTYRCPTLVAKMANKLLAIKNHIFEGLSDKYELKQIALDTEEKAGEIDWLDTMPAVDDMHNQVNEIRRKYGLKATEVALIVADEEVKRIKKDTGLPLIFSAESIKGLEYKCVIVCEPLKGLMPLHAHLPGQYDEDTLKIKNTRAKTQGSPQKKSATELSNQYAVKLNKVFVSLTRTSKNLIIWQPVHDKKLFRLIGHLKSVLLPSESEVLQASSQKASAEEPKASPEMVETSRDDWLDECMRVYYSGNRKQAESIYNQNIKEVDGADFSEFLKEKHSQEAMPLKPVAQILPASEQMASSLVESKKSTISVASNKKIKAANQMADKAPEKLVKVVESQLPSIDERKSNQITLTKEEQKVLEIEKIKKMDVLSKLLLTANDMGAISKKLLTSLFKEPFYDEVLLNRKVKSGNNSYQSLMTFLMVSHNSRESIIQFVCAAGNELIRDTLCDKLHEQFSDAFFNIEKPESLQLVIASVYFIDRVSINESQLMSSILDNLVPFYNDEYLVFHHLHELDCLELILSQHPEYFIEKGGLNAIHKVCEGRAIFYDMCKNISLDNNILDRHWPTIRPSLSAERLHCPTSSDYKSPFYILCSSEEGIEFIDNHFSFFEPIITQDGLYQKITGDVFSYNRSAFFELISSNKGLSLLRKHWPFFKILIIHEQMHIPRLIPFVDNKYMRSKNERAYEIDGSNQREYYMAETPFHHCALKEQGLALIKHDLDFFLSQTTSPQLHAAMECADFGDACTPFEALSSTPEGVSFIVSHWQDYFQSKVCVDDLKSKSTTPLGLRLIENGYFISEKRQQPAMECQAHKMANHMYLAAQINHTCFFKLWAMDLEQAFLTYPMANGKSAFVMLNEKAHFDSIIFDGRKSAALVKHLKREYTDIEKQLTDESKEDVVLLMLHLASCFDVNHQTEEETNNLTKTELLIDQLEALGFSWKDIIKKHIPSSARVALHFLNYAIMQHSNFSKPNILIELWPYFCQVLVGSPSAISGYVYSRLSEMQLGRELLIRELNAFSTVTSEPLFAIFNSSTFSTLSKANWIDISQKISTQKLHEIHPKFQKSAFELLCSSAQGYQALVSNWSLLKDKINKVHLVDNPTAYNREGLTPFHPDYKNHLVEMLKQDGCFLNDKSQTSSSKKKRNNKRKKKKSHAENLERNGFFANETGDNETNSKADMTQEQNLGFS